MSTNFYQLRLLDKIKETEDSSSLIFEIPEDLKDIFSYKAGQYLTLKTTVKGSEERRAYSIFTPPYAKETGVTVKRVKGGKVSNYLIDNLQVGDTIEVMPPEGKFVIKPDHQQERDHYFIAGGSGITPIMSMIKTVLEEEPKSTCYLLYASRSEAAVIFKKELDDMILRFEDQLYLDYIISQPTQQKKGGLSGLFGKKAAPTWRGLKGRINTDILDRYFEDHPSKTGNNTYYLCGPGALIENTQAYLERQGAEGVQIKKEYFTADSATPKAAPISSGSGCTATVKLSGETFTINIPGDKTVLDALVDEGKDPPYSCTSGACSTCIAKVTAGEVKMDACFALDDEEVADGYVLTCQSRCQTATLELDFDA